MYCSKTFETTMGIGDWGLGIGDWGFGIVDCALGLMRN